MNRLLKRANRRISFGGAAALLMGIALFGQGLGFFRNRLVSNFTKLDPGSTDVFFAAFQIPDFFFMTITAGALGVAFMPVVSDRLADSDRKKVWELTSSVLNALVIAMSVVAVIILIFARPLLHNIVARNLSPHQLDQATLIMRLIALNPLLFTISGILTSIQQVFGRFFFFAVAPLVYNLAIIVSAYVSIHGVGIVGLGYGAAIGALLQVGVASLGLLGMGFKWYPKLMYKSKDFKQVLRQLPARSIDQGIDSINSIVETNRANFLGKGNITYYNFATTLHNVPIMLFGTSIATASFPRLVERLSQKRPDLFRKEFLNILRAMIWIAAPVVVISYFARAYFARILFGDSAPQVASIFGFLATAIFFRIIYSIMSRYFYAQKDTKTPLFVSLFAIGLNIVLAFRLARPSLYGVQGLAIAQSIVAASEVLILLCVMLKRDRKLFDIRFWGGFMRIISVTGFSSITALVMVQLVPLQATDKGFLLLLSKLALIAVPALMVHFSFSSLFGLEETRPVIEKVKKFILKPIRIQ